MSLKLSQVSDASGVIVVISFPPISPFVCGGDSSRRIVCGPDEGPVSALAAGE